MTGGNTEHIRRIPSLDGIRAVAALLVFLYHSELLPGIIPGAFGVTVFFFLSGFLITTLLRIEYERTGAISIRDFYLRRAYRILPPMYLVMLLACVPPIGHIGTETTAGAIAAQATNLTNYYLIFRGDHLIPNTGVMWSLAVEEHFYLLFPFVLIALLGRLRNWQVGVVLALACLVVLLWRCVLVLNLSPPHDYTAFASDTRIDSILYGCILGICLNPVLDGDRLRVKPRVWPYLVGLCAILLVASEAYGGEIYRATFRYTLQGLCLAPLFFCAVRFNCSPVFRWLEWPALRGLGVISYTFYLCHPKALAIAARLGWNSWARALLGLALAIAFSSLVYFVVERPFARLRRRLHGRQNRRSDRTRHSEPATRPA